MSATSAPATCVIHPSAKIGAGTTFGEYCVVGANVTLGEGCRVGHHVVIHADTSIGANVRIDDHASLGKSPMKAANSATTKEQELPPLTVGDTCIVGTGVVLYRGAAIDAKVLMADLSTVRETSPWAAARSSAAASRSRTSARWGATASSRASATCAPTRRSRTGCSWPRAW